jgi:hypothetical protein
MKQVRAVSHSVLMVLILGMALALPSPASSPQTRQGSWENVGRIAPGDTVMVVLNSTQSNEGKFKTSSTDSITIQTKSGEESFQRENVLRISARGQKHRGRNVLIGASIGAGAGLGLGAAADRGTKCGPSGPFLCGGSSNVGKEVLTPLGAIVGGLVGLALPTGRWQEVYRAR